MDAHELIKCKEVIMTDLSEARLEFKKQEARLLLETDFKELKLTNDKMRTAYITEQLFNHKTRIETLEIRLTIVSDLLRLRLTEGGETQ